ncbi:MAG: HNH endonuclease [Colwellia sp.]|nr:HNH endonuclease [Colwellia sp.]
MIKAKIRRTKDYSDGSHNLEIHIKKSEIDNLPLITNERVEINLIAGKESCLAGLRMTQNNIYAWISPDVYINSEKHRLSEFLLHINAKANDVILLEYRNSNLYIYNHEDIKVGLISSITEEELPEGAKQRITVNKYERNIKAKMKCIEKYGTSCVVCGFNSEDTYGYEAKNIIHVHHLNPIAKVGEIYNVDPEVDLRPVCPNCHAVIHRNSGCDSIEKVRKMIDKNRKKHQ